MQIERPNGSMVRGRMMLGEVIREIVFASSAPPFVWLRLRLHMLICKPCPRFVRQVKIMGGAMGRWRQYAESADPAAGGAPGAGRVS